MKLEVLEKLGYRTDVIAPSEIDILFDDAMQLLRDRIDQENPEYLERFDNDLRDRISQLAQENLAPEIEKFTQVIGRKLKQWQGEGLSLEEVRDRIDSIYKLDEYNDEGFSNGLAEWLAIATLSGQDQAGFA
jgi:hypothetical protein